MENTSTLNKTVPAFNYSLDANENASRYGRYYYGVILSDGRELMFHADKVVVTPTGDMLAVSNSFVNSDEVCVPAEESRTLLALASGQWTAYYGASVMSGDPVVIDHLPAPAKK